MGYAVIMPKQGQSVESCILTEWLIKKGEQVKKGDRLFAYETDKAAFEEEALYDGILLETFFNEGDEVPVLVNIAVIGNEGESTSEFSSQSENSEKAEIAKAEKKLDQIIEMPSFEVVSNNASIQSGDCKISPRAKRLANQKSIPYQQIAGSGPEGRIIERDIEAAIAHFPRVSPLAQRVAVETGLTTPIAGSGLDNAVISNDLKSTTPNIAQPTSTVSGIADSFTDKPLTNIRKLIAKSMHASLQNSAQLTHHLSANATKLFALREKVKKMVAAGYPFNLTLNDMVCFAVIKALKAHPEANAHFMGDAIRTFSNVNLGLAVDTDRGLMVPAVKCVENMTITELSQKLKTVAENCKKGNIEPDLLISTAASFTISNLGNYGVEMFTPIINVPQVCILGVCTTTLRPTQFENGMFGFAPFMGLSLTYDHRAIDGGPATKLLAAIKFEIENFDVQL